MNDENANARTDTLIKIISLFVLVLIVIAFTTNPIATGVGVGERVPLLEGKIYNGNGWVDYNLHDQFDTNWTEGDTNATWYIIEFLDTDCSACWRDTAKVSDLQNAVSSTQWNRAPVQMLAVVVELNIPNHESSRDEIKAFRDKNDGDGTFKCNADRALCSERDGSPYNFPFFDDLDGKSTKEWDIPGTPTYFIIKPNGIVAWSSVEAGNSDIFDAVNGLIPEA